MSTPENEEVESSDTPVDPAVAAESSEVSAEASSSEAAPDDESLDIEVETDDADEAGGVAEVEVDPMAELEAKLAEAEKAKQENYDRFVRVTADLENVRKRSRREVKDGRLDERGKVLRDMLPVIDNLDRAVEHAKQADNEATKSIVEGVEMVLRQFAQALERHNVKALDAVGKPFDPAVHEAVSQAPSADHPPGTVISVLQTGYMMEERLLRPALAVVSIAMPEAAKAEEAEGAAEEAEGAEDAAEEPATEEPATEDAETEGKE